jgi:tRNA pseudouridine38-40 synthase
VTSSANWKLTLSYNGSGFHGWQVQPGFTTVQGTLAEAIARLTGERVLPQGSGRTDAGVHALTQVATFRLQAPVPPANLHRALNRILPDTIRILSVDPAPPGFHARHSARGKTYEYRIFERRIPPRPGEPAQPAQERICSPFLAPFVWDCPWPLELAPMQQAAALLLGAHDFTSLAASDPERSMRDPEQARSQPDSEDDATDSNDGPARPIRINPVKTITQSEWIRGEDRLLLYRITGSGFLHHMVRNIVGTLVDIGRGSLAVADLERILAARDRTAAGPTAPARGLYLVEVHYDDPTPNTGWPIHDDSSIVGMSGISSSDTPTGWPIHDDSSIVGMSGISSSDTPNAGCPIHDDSPIVGMSGVSSSHTPTGWPIHDDSSIVGMSGVSFSDTPGEREP